MTIKHTTPLSLCFITEDIEFSAHNIMEITIE